MKFDNHLTDIVMLDLAIDSVPALLGEPGIGKSAFVRDLAKAMDTRAFVLACNQLADKSDLTGARLVYNEDTKSWSQVFYPHTTVQAAVEYARDNPRENPILFMDEINRTTSDVTSASLTMVTERKLGREDFPENLRIMIAGNDKGNVTALDEASISRFSIYRVEPDAHTLIQILGDAINPHVREVLVRHPETVFQKSRPVVFASDGDDDDDKDNNVMMTEIMDAGDEMLQLTTPRTIEGISKWLNAVDPAKLQEYFQTTVVNNKIESTMLQDIITAHVGDTDFATFLLAEISSGLSSGVVGQVTQLTAPKPNCFNSLKKAGTVSDLEDLIRDLTDKERSSSLVYALFERADNKIIIEQLAQQTTGIEKEHNALLVQLAASSQLDDKNVETLFGAGTSLSDSMKMVLSAFM